jgi:hypothetical protein
MDSTGPCRFAIQARTGVVSFLEMPTKQKSVSERSLTPLCLRFRAQDLEAVRAVAAKSAEACTVFLREVIMTRVVAIESELDVPKLTYGKNGVVSESISIRFRPAEYKRAARVAARDGVPFSLWGRAVVLEYVQRPKVPSIRGGNGRQERDTAVGE